MVFEINSVQDSTGAVIKWDLSNLFVHYLLFLLALVFVGIDDDRVLSISTGSIWLEDGKVVEK